jgi:hypothetical protein
MGCRRLMYRLEWVPVSREHLAFYDEHLRIQCGAARLANDPNNLAPADLRAFVWMELRRLQRRFVREWRRTHGS